MPFDLSRELAEPPNDQAILPAAGGGGGIVGR